MVDGVFTVTVTSTAPQIHCRDGLADDRGGPDADGLELAAGSTASCTQAEM